MTRVECTRESEIFEAIAAGRALSDELGAHAAGCAICRDLAGVASAIHHDFNAAMREAHVPSSGVAWWRIQRRAQEKAVRVASRTVTFVQLATLAGTACLVLAILGGMSLMKQDWKLWIDRAYFSAIDYFASPAIMLWAAPIAFMFLTLVPFAIYYAVTEE